MSKVPITIAGAEKLRAELQELKTVQRPAMKRKPFLSVPCSMALTLQEWPLGATFDRHSRVFSLPASTA